VRVSSVRLVSFAHRAVAAIADEVEPLEAAARLVVQSELVANEPMPDADELARDPRAAASLVSSLRSEEFSGRDAEVVLVRSTSASGLRRLAMAVTRSGTRRCSFCRS
jgi:alpha,alpha-trehalose phosphorylase